jgi:1-acyl-sn-glycerol-3-phosphate acyltransferase
MTFYDFAKTVIYVVARILWRVRGYGTANVPASGPVILACNHVSNLDPPLLGCVCPRRVHYMAKKELFEIPVLGPLIRACRAYPVDREGSAAAAIKRSVEVLRAGECVGIFPEGGRNVAGEKEARAGVALLASLAKAPVVPSCVIGSANARRLGRVRVAYGTPMELPKDRKATRDDLVNFTDEIMDAIHSLEKTYADAR